MAQADRLQPATVDLGDITAVLQAEGQQPGGKARQAEPAHRKAEIDQIHLDQQRRIADDLDIAAGQPAERPARRLRQCHEETPDDADRDRQNRQLDGDLGTLEQRRHQPRNATRAMPVAQYQPAWQCCAFRRRPHATILRRNV